MIDIKLNSISIENFKGIYELKVDLKGKSAEIRGKNATGKSSIIDAFYWLISNKNSDLKADFNIIRLNSEKAIVESEFSIDKEIVKLKKIHIKKFKKTKGKIERLFSGYTTNHFVNDLAVNQTEYINRISSYIDIDMFRLLSDVKFFHTTKIDYRRDLLMNLIPNITDDDIIRQDKSLISLSDKNIPEMKKSLLAQQKSIDLELNKLSILVDECLNKKIDESKKDIQSLENYELRRKETISKIKNIDRNNEVIELKKQLAQLELENYENEIEFKRSNQAKNEDLQRKKNDVLNQKDIKKYKLSSICNEIEGKDIKILSLDAKLNDLLKQWKSINAIDFSICSLCNQEIPAANQKLIKAKKLKEIDIIGAKCSNEKASLKNKIDELTNEKKEIEKKIKEYDEISKDIASKIHELNNANGSKYAKSQIEYINKVNSINEKITNLDVNEENTNLQEELTMIEDKIKSINNRKLINDLNEKNLNTYYKKIKTLSKNYEINEMQLDLVENYDIKRAKIIEDNVSSKFKITDWKLFEIQRNQGIKNICEPYFDDVPYSDLNTGSKINIMIDITDTISENAKVKTPLFIDKAESITSWIDTDRQIIKLIVDEKLDKLDIKIMED